MPAWPGSWGTSRGFCKTWKYSSQTHLVLLQVLSALRRKRLAAFISSLYQGTAGLTFTVLVLSGAWQSITLESVVLYLRTRAKENYQETLKPSSLPSKQRLVSWYS